MKFDQIGTSVFLDIRSLGHDNKLELIEELLNLMARDKHSAEVSQDGIRCRHDDFRFEHVH